MPIIILQHCMPISGCIIGALLSRFTKLHTLIIILPFLCLSTRLWPIVTRRWQAGWDSS